MTPRTEIAYVGGRWSWDALNGDGVHDTEAHRVYDDTARDRREARHAVGFMFDTIMPDEYVTLDGIQKTIDRIAEYGDFYGNHDLEDELYERVLRGIATGQCSDPVACAALALKTKDFPFPRYTA